MVNFMVKGVVDAINITCCVMRGSMGVCVDLIGSECLVTRLFVDNQHKLVFAFGVAIPDWAKGPRQSSLGREPQDLNRAKSGVLKARSIALIPQILKVILDAEFFEEL